MRLIKKTNVIVVSLIAGLVLSPMQGLADMDEIQALKDEIAAMKAKMGALEEHLRKAEIQSTVAEAPSTGIPGKITNFAKEIEVHGSVDAAYIFNSNTPVSPNGQTNVIRVFDREANGFILNLAEINFEKPISQESPVGFRVDLDFGEDAEVFGAAGLGTQDDEFELQQAYVQFYVPFVLPFMHALNFKVGKFVTLHGAEVIESVDNWNFSRSLLFGYAIPFTHT